jgi:lysozyme
MNLIGIDISSAQGTINWDQVASSNIVNYVFCKATEGLTYKDPCFDKNWKAIKDHGWIRGAYHFARLNNDPVAEADFFISTVGALDETDMLVLDVETSTLTGEAFLQWNLSWLERVESQTGVTPIVYTGGPFFTSHGKPSVDEIKRFAHFPLWLAAYVNSPDKYIPVEWKDVGWKIWQHTGDVAPTGSSVLHVPGIHGNVDRDEFVGSLDDLKSFASSLHAQASDDPYGAQ